MTQKVNPSPQRPASSFKTAGAIAYGGGSQDGYIVPNNETTEIAIQDQDISTTGINQFTETTSSNSFDVSIDGGEAFVFGAWVCTDTTTTITLAQNTSNQKVFLGWNKSAADNVIIGTESTFSITPGDTDQKIPLYSFDTNSTGVTNTTDLRSFNATGKGGLNIHEKTLQTGRTVTITNNEGAVASNEYTVNGTLTIEQNGSLSIV